MIKLSKLTINSSDQVPELIDITLQVKKLVEESGVQNGQALVFAQHTTAAVVIQEPEPGVLKDFKVFLTELLPKDKHYHHTVAPDHLKDQMPNGHSHCQSLLLPTSETIPIENKQLLLGTFQHIFLVELDRARSRTVVVQVSGE